ncbi:prolactin-4A1-like [Peromyscus californicus insignis]|uniref:prolactin-4A1-like n=1 Tax=Peromyscus californicus insignis TaxID=564181 RepID=UPI0022A751FB|nr:prolactin-4A1-like [Peromyscus californicus insignis]
MAVVQSDRGRTSSWQWNKAMWTLFLLLIPIVRSENMTSAVKVKMLNVSYHSPFGEMLDQAIKSSQYMNRRISELSTHFNRFYASGRGFNNKITRCHTSSLSRPENKEQAQNTESEVLLKLAHGLLQSWVNPLHHLWVEMGDKLGYTPPYLTKALEIKAINRNLLGAMKKITSKANFALEENVDAPAWSELASLQSTNRNTRYFAFYNLFHCLGRDSNDVEMYLKLLKCRMVQSNC